VDRAGKRLREADVKDVRHTWRSTASAPEIQIPGDHVTIDPPAGFSVYTASAGLADDGRDDLTVILSDVPATSAAMFTKSRFAGPSIILSREAARTRRVRGVIVVARNANVATGEQGAEHAA